ncbi:MAG: ABC transporter substrate-binding protein [Chloroflexota bacterium]
MKYLVSMVTVLWIFTLTSAQEVDCETDSYLFEHEHLATESLCIPENAERIAVLDPFTFEFAVALDVPIVATPQIYIEQFTTNFPSYSDAFDAVNDTSIPLNLESLLTANVDIILCRRSACEDSFEQLAQVAPTVMFDNESASDWRESSRFYAEVLGIDDTLVDVEATFDARLTMLAEELEATFGEQAPSISVLRVRPGQLRFYFEDSSAGIIWSSVGFTSPETQVEIIQSSIDRLGDARLANISTEQIPLVDADYVFVFATDGLTDGDGLAYLEETRANPLWQALTAVQDEQLYIVGNYWFSSGYIAAHAIVDDLFTFVLDSDVIAISPNPFNMSNNENSEESP